jgi:hypothetical protein
MNPQETEGSVFGQNGLAGQELAAPEASAEAAPPAQLLDEMALALVPGVGPRTYQKL